MAKVFHTPPKSVGRSGASSRFDRCPLKDHVSPEPSRKTPRSKTPRKQVSRLRNVYNGTFENIHTDLIVSATTIAIIATSSDVQSTNQPYQSSSDVMSQGIGCIESFSTLLQRNKSSALTYLGFLGSVSEGVNVFYTLPCVWGLKQEPWKFVVLIEVMYLIFPMALRTDMLNHIRNHHCKCNELWSLNQS